MKIKAKLRLGVGTLFVLIILLGAVGARYINALKNDTDLILVANYNTLEYSLNMLAELEKPDTPALQRFDENLKKQERNITEKGENISTAELRKHFSVFRTNPNDSLIKIHIRKEIFAIMKMNMEAIQHKSELAKSTAGTATLWIAITGTLCFLIAFVLLINLPSSIANPIRELTGSIKQIAARNYSQRVHFQDHNEFGDLARSFNSMAEKLEEYNNSNLARLMMEKKRIETLVNNMNDPVIGLNEQERVIFVNREASKIIGLSEVEMLGKSGEELSRINDLFRSLIKDTAKESTPNKQKTFKIFSQGKEGYFEKELLNISIVPTGEKEEQPVGKVIILRDVTTYKEMDAAKTNFIATISHEFKTPISSIKMSLQLLDNKSIGTLNEEQSHLVESIKDDTNRLLRITGELLNMTQVESGNIQLAIVHSDAREILEYAIQANKTPATQKQINFQVKCETPLPSVLADREKTAWVLTNLISNAIRYSYENSTIYLEIKRDDTRIKFIVRDTGQGIAPEFIGKVFERYFRVPGTNKEGTGLGLSISKEFIEAQGGEIAVESEYGAGSTFTVTLNAV